MEYRGYPKFVNGRSFDMHQDSKLGGVPVYENESIEVKCTKCSSKTTFLMQLCVPSTNRILYIFYCPEHVTDNVGWYLCCKPGVQNRWRRLNVFEEHCSTIDAMSSFNSASVSDWLSNISINNSLEETFIYFERDRTEDCVYEGDSHTFDLLENYKNRNISEIDDEDIADRTIVINKDFESEGSSDSFSEDEIYYINRFQNYISRKPNTVLRYNRNGLPISFTEFYHDAKCEKCNTNLTFELQLLPGIVNYLDKECTELARMVLGSVLFYTCKLYLRINNNTGPKDCSTSGFIEHGFVLKYN